MPSWAHGGFLQLSIPPLPLSALPLQPFLLSLPSLRLACNSDESRAIQICQAVSHRVVAQDFGRGWHRTPRARLCRGCGERAGLALSFFLLESSSGAEVAAAVPGPRSQSRGWGQPARGAGAAELLASSPGCSASASPAHAAPAELNLVIHYFFPYSISSTCCTGPEGQS